MIPSNLSLHYDEMGGYGCITPAYILKDSDTGSVVAVLDLREYGATSTSTHDELWEIRRRVNAIGIRLMEGYNRATS